MVLPSVMLWVALVGVMDPTPAAPARGLVVVLSPDAEEEVTRNATARIKGELAAAPFEVVTRPLAPGVDLMREVETAGQDLAPVAAFAIVHEGGPGSREVAVWVSNRITQTTTVHRVQIRSDDADGAAARLAIEAVELVRASMAGLWPRPPEPPPPPPPEAAPAERRAGVHLGIGVGAFAETGSAPSLLAPTVALAYGQPERLVVRLRLVGLGPGTEVSGPDGTGARLQRAAGTLGVLRLWRPEGTLRPLLSAGVGAQYLGAEGTGAPPVRERGLSVWSALVTAGAGCAAVLGPHLALVVEADLLLTWPKAVVEVAKADVANFGRASVLFNGGVLATF